jgi:hypothetical protein
MEMHIESGLDARSGLVVIGGAPKVMQLIELNAIHKMLGQYASGVVMEY